MRIRIILFLIVCNFSDNAFSQVFTPESRWKFYRNICEKYSPDAAEILNSFENWKPYADYAKDANSVIELINESHTVVHEGCHGYNSEIADLADVGDGYYIAPGITIPVVEGVVYNSNELNRIVADSLEKKIFRYDTYIGDASDVSSQQSGLYGLLDEFSAYYHATKFAYDLRPWFEEYYGYKDALPWIDGYVWAIGSSATAFYEFRLFMAWYLKYARQNRPAVYASLMENKNLRLAFTLLYDKFEESAGNYEGELDRVAATLVKKGFKVKRETEFLMIYNENGSGTGRGHYMAEIHFLEKLFTPELKTELTKFRMVGATMENYQNYFVSVEE